MNIQINEYAKKINELHNLIGVQLKTPLKTAIEIGKLLIDVKNNIGHGNFLTWINDNCYFDDRTAQRYIKLHNYKIDNVSNLQEAYKKIEQLEFQEKQTEYQRKRNLINQYINTGIKPDNWDRSLDYEYSKIKKENEERTKRIEEMNKKEKERITEKSSLDTEYDNIMNLTTKHLLEWEERERKKNELKNKIGMSINDESKFIDALDSYLNSLQSDNIRLNALHNIIKYCKQKANQYQMISIK